MMTDNLFHPTDEQRLSAFLKNECDHDGARIAYFGNRRLLDCDRCKNLNDVSRIRILHSSVNKSRKIKVW